MSFHAFVAMPFGTKDGIDFNRIYEDLIKPALKAAEFEVFRADEEMRAGEIRKDMFQELLLADLVVVDLSIDNPNVWYELGVRHGLRQRGVIQIGCRKDRLPFDVVTDRTFRYQLKDAALDPSTVEAQRQKLSAFARETMNAWHGWKVSPVYQLLPFLQEPDWRSLAVEGLQEFWELQRQWSGRIDVARRRNRPGDILVLAEETPTWVLKLEARRVAGAALTKLGQFRLALEQYEDALKIDPKDRVSRQQHGIVLGRLGRREEARQEIESIVKDFNKDPESWALLGRLEKEEWISRWRQPNLVPAEMRRRAAEQLEFLDAAAEPYRKAFVLDPGHFYSAINAVTLVRLHGHLDGNSMDSEVVQQLEAGASWACQAAMERDPKDYWARASFAELGLLTGETAKVSREYKAAAAAAEKDWFKLDSSRQQLLLLRDLEFRPEAVAAALQAVDKELSEATPVWKSRKVFLFSGHMIDKPGREKPRFPAEKEPVAAKAIRERLRILDAGPEDLAICGGACGGDTLFAEACIEQKMRLQLHLQLKEPEFLRASVSFAGPQWIERFEMLKSNPLCSIFIQPECLGLPPKTRDIYERNNHWQLYTALSCGPEKVHFIALWDGKSGDGRGGTQHMVSSVEEHGGKAYVIKTTELWDTPS